MEEEVTMTEKERMLAGKPYMAMTDELMREHKRAARLTRLINNSTEEEVGYRKALFQELFCKIGGHFWIEPPFRCDYGGQISIGENFFANYDCVILDVCPVDIGDNVLFGPRVCVYTASHPTDAEVRATQLEYGRAVSIGNNVWVGGNTVINPGVSIGGGAVIGAGSIVTKDVPAGVIAAGNPCRVLRKITEEDHRRWETEEQEYRHAEDSVDNTFKTEP